MKFEDILIKLEDSLAEEKPFVLFRKPEKRFVHAFFQKNDQLYFLEEFSQSGFLFAPFDSSKPSILFPNERSEIYVAEIPERLLPDKKNKNLSTKIYREEEKKVHMDLVQRGIEFIRTGNVSKVVLSRKEEVALKGLPLSNTFKKLLYHYPAAFVSVWYHPKIGLWFGATPETLVNVQGDIFQTMALAGTQVYKGTVEVEWGEKEKKEQQLVTDFILSNLSDRYLEVSDPYSKKAGSLLHICTKIDGSFNKGDSIGELIDKLHPTPAVCGLPKNDAKAFILRNENYNREFYSGYLGTLNINERSELYVNLRCMKVKEKKAFLFVGGGITAESDPENEWKETVAKSEVMKKVIFG